MYYSRNDLAETSPHSSLFKDSDSRNVHFRDDMGRFEGIQLMNYSMPCHIMVRFAGMTVASPEIEITVLFSGEDYASGFR